MDAGANRLEAAPTRSLTNTLAQLGRRMPAQLRVFLLILAIVDDIGSILVIAVGRVSGRTKMTGSELDAGVADAWTLRNGKAVRCQSYHERDKWLEAPGGSNAQAQRLAA